MTNTRNIAFWNRPILVAVLKHLLLFKHRTKGDFEFIEGAAVLNQSKINANLTIWKGITEFSVYMSANPPGNRMVPDAL